MIESLSMEVPVVGDQGAELVVLVVERAEAAAPVEVVAVAEAVVDPGGKQVAVLTEGEDAAVGLEDAGDEGVGCGREGAGERLGEAGQLRHAARAQGVQQGLLRGGGGVEGAAVLEDGHEGGFLAVEALVGGEEEGAVAAQGAADGGASLGAGIGGLPGIEVVAGLDVAVAEEAEEVAVEPVAAAAGDDVDGAAAGPAEFGRGGVAVDLELLDGLLADAEADAAGVDVVLDSVDEEAVAAAVAAAEADAGLRGLGHAVVGAVDQVLGGGGGRGEQGEVEVIAAIDGQLRDAGQIDGGRLLGALAVDDGRFGGDFDDLLQPADFEAHGQGEGISDADLDALEDLRREASGLDADAVAAGRKDGEHELAGFVGFGGALDGAVRVGGHELRAADGGTAGVSNSAADFPGVALRLGICWKAGKGRDGQDRQRLHRFNSPTPL